MNYLAIDTSGKNLTVIVKCGEQIKTIHDEECGVNHSVELMPRVEQILKEMNFQLKDADFIACVVGAGSFTGIRIGVSTVKALCFAYNKPCLSITSFDTLAYNRKGKTLAVIDAKHGGYYACGYNDFNICLEPCYILKDQLLELSKDYSVVSSTVLNEIPHELVSVKDGLIKAIEHNCDKISLDADSLTPLYVRKSQAEEGR